MPWKLLLLRRLSLDQDFSSASLKTCLCLHPSLFPLIVWVQNPQLIHKQDSLLQLAWLPEPRKGKSLKSSQIPPHPLVSVFYFHRARENLSSGDSPHRVEKECGVVSLSEMSTGHIFCVKQLFATLLVSNTCNILIELHIPRLARKEEELHFFTDCCFP